MLGTFENERKVSNLQLPSSKSENSETVFILDSVFWGDHISGERINVVMMKFFFSGGITDSGGGGKFPPPPRRYLELTLLGNKLRIKQTLGIHMLNIAGAKWD